MHPSVGFESPGIRGIRPRADGVTGATERTHQLVIFLQQRLLVLQGLTVQKSSRRSKPVLGEISIALYSPGSRQVPTLLLSVVTA